MRELKKMATAALGLVLLFCTGCELDECTEASVCDEPQGGTDGGGEECDEAGVCDGESIIREPSTFDTVIVFDDGSMDDGAGTSGADICDVSADCASAVSALAVLGGGQLCTAEGPGCSANRTDPNAAFDAADGCEAASVPSDYISLGIDGRIAVGFDGDLAGCNVTVVEFAGATQEPYEVYVCDDANLGTATCLNNDQPVHSAAAGGEATFAVPAE